MAEKDPAQIGDLRSAGPELRLIDRRAFVGFPALTLSPGVVVTDFALQIPDVTFPLNLSGGATKYQKRKLDFGFLDVSLSADIITRSLPTLSKHLGEVADIKLHFKAGFLEAQARLVSAERAPVTFKVAFDGDGDRLAVYLYDVRLYGFTSLPASRVAAVVGEAVARSALLPSVERRGANGFSAGLVSELVELCAVGRGYKMPSVEQARLAEAVVSTKGLRLRFAAAGLPPPGVPDDELLLALEGARAFADAEELVAQGHLAEAREAYLKLGDATDAHPFAVERLLTLLVADPQAHELALDVAASLNRRRPKSPTAIWAEAVVRERRGEWARASERYLALCNLARANGEEASAFFAAEAAARASRDSAPHMAVKALHELLGLKPDHLPSLKALARASDQANDRAGSIRAYRRLAALARDPNDAAEAHVQLARLCAQTEDDVAGARLHCEAALRLKPDHPEALLQLGELCFRSNEHLRAIKALDRLREVALARHEVDRVGRASLLAGHVWETGLKQLENASLRYKEAVSLLPGEAGPHYFTGRAAEGLGRVQEALASYTQAIELAGPTPAAEDVRTVAHQSHHALARLFKHKLGEPTRAREHLESALTLVPTDTSALDELLPFFRASGKTQALADACEKAAAVALEPGRRAALWAEAGELYRGRLAQPERAERLFSQAIEADGSNRVGLEGLLALAEAKRDGGQLTRCLKALAAITTEPKERSRLSRRLAVAARDLAFDLDIAAAAYRDVLRAEPDDLPVLGELTALERRRNDMAGLAWALEQRARTAETVGDKRLAAAALRELGQVLDARLGRPGDALVALEKAARLFPETAALVDLATLCLRLERAPAARRALEEALALLPKHAPPERVADIRAKLGRACELVGDREGAVEAYAAAFPIRRLDDELAARLEALYLEGNELRALTDLWASRAQALLHAGRPLDAAPLFFKSAKRLQETGDVGGAMLRLTSALDAAPQGPLANEVLEAMADLESARGEFNEAARLYARRASHAASPREAARTFYKAATLTRGGPRERGYVDQALERDALFAPARLRRADLLEAEAPAAALADLEAVLGLLADDPDAQAMQLDAVALGRRAGFAALASGQHDAARRLLASYAAQRPQDLDAQLELASLHRRVGAIDALVASLGELWPRLSGPARAAARKEYAEGALSLGQTQAAAEALRSMLGDQPDDAWAAQRLLNLVPADEAHRAERVELLSRLVLTATGEEKAELLARRSELSRQAGDLASARADLLDAAQVSNRPVPLLRALAELARQSADDGAELVAWRQLLGQSAADAAIKADAVERLFGLASSRQSAGDAARAMEAFETLITLPLSGLQRLEAFAGLGETALRLGATRRAEESFSVAAQQGPVSRRVSVLLTMASLQEARGGLTEAADAYERILALAPRHPEALAGLLSALRRQGDAAGVAEVLLAEAEALPKAKALPLWRELSELYLGALGQLGPGEAALRKVVSLDANDAEAKVRLARLVAGINWAEAVQLYEISSALLPAPQGAQLLREAASIADTHSEAELTLKLLRKAHTLEPATGDQLETLAQALYLKGAMAEALPLQQALAAQASFDDAPDVAEQRLLRLADLALQLEDKPLAERTLRRVVTERPLNGDAVERLAGLVAPQEALGLRARHLESLSPSPRIAARLQQLAEEARALRDAETAVRLLGAAAASTEQPLAVKELLVTWLREDERDDSLSSALLEVAQLRLVGGDVAGALTAYSEEATLCERLGRVDDALRTYTAMADVCSDEGLDEEAAESLLKKAHLLRDAKLDLVGAAEALDAAWSLTRSPAIAEEAGALAKRRNDREAQVDWLERTFSSLVEPSARSHGFVQLARLHLGATSADEVATAPLFAAEQAEAALKAALAAVPRQPEAEALLLALHERQQRPTDTAAYFEEAAVLADDASKAGLLIRAADLYGQGQRPHEAAAALMAARTAAPDDLQLTARLADALEALGRTQDAADFDAVVLASEPFHPSAVRHRAFLEDQGDWQAVAALLSRQAEQTQGEGAAVPWLEAAHAFRQAGAFERAQVCEAQAFEAAPGNRLAFEQLLEHAQGDTRRQAELYALRARAVPSEASQLLRTRAELLGQGRETLAAAGAWDDYLAVVPDDASALIARAQLANEAGGPAAAQPYDRRLVSLASGAVGSPALVAAWLRLGQAALDAQAWRDAADAFEAVLSQQPTEAQTQAALSLGAEASARLGDTKSQYVATLRLAQRSHGPEAEALYRRAAEVSPTAGEAIEALEALVGIHPGEPGFAKRLAEGYQQLGRWGEVVRVLESHARALGGPRGADALMQAATIAETELGEATRALELRAEAASIDPGNQAVRRSLLDEVRRRGERDAQLRLLGELVALDVADATPLRLERFAVLEELGRFDEAAATLQPLLDAGPSSEGYAQALFSALKLARQQSRHADVAQLLRRKLALEPSTQAQAALLLELAQAAEAAGLAIDADTALRESLALRVTEAGVALELTLARKRREPARLVRALSASAAQLPAQRMELMREALDVASDAGLADTALDLLEKLYAEQALSPLDAAQRFSRFGAAQRALAVGFEAALAEGDAALALLLAKAAHDEGKTTQARWAVVELQPTSPEVRALESRARESGDSSALRRLAQLALRGGQRDRAQALFIERALEGDSEAFDVVWQHGWGQALSAQAVATPSVPALTALFDRDIAPWPQADQVELLKAVAQAVPMRRKPALRRWADLCATPAEAAQVLGQLAHLEDDTKARAALHLERAERWRQASEKNQMRVAYELALADDATQVAAVRALVDVYQGVDADRFVTMAERLGALAGEESLEPYHLPLADALEASGRLRDAAKHLAYVPETTSLLKRRAMLAERLGFTGEALTLRERFTEDAEGLGAILEGYLAAQLVPFAAKLGAQLLFGGTLSAQRQRLLAERLAATEQGASVAVQAWVPLLRAQPADTDGWTLFAEALRRTGRHHEASLADGFGAALASSESPAAQVTPTAIRPDAVPAVDVTPADAVAISGDTMPRLALTLAEAASGLGVANLEFKLAPRGGVEVYLSAPGVVTIGVGALTVFGPAELSAALALAVALGADGRLLTQTGSVDTLELAAVIALDAYPSSLALCRVAAHYDARVRGSAPELVQTGEILADSEVFRGLASRALERLG
jgi:tetratricopeptide (TPR) repeat protein